MKVFVLLSLVAASSALTVSPGSGHAALRPSISSFKPRPTISLRGGGSDFRFPPAGTDLPIIDTDTALMANMLVYGIYGLLIQPDLKLPLVDMTFTAHDTHASLFYGDDMPETGTQVKQNRWIANGFFAIAALCHAVYKSGSEQTKKKACRGLAIVGVLDVVTLFFNNQPIACGRPLITPILLIASGIAGFS